MILHHARPKLVSLCGLSGGGGGRSFAGDFGILTLTNGQILGDLSVQYWCNGQTMSAGLYKFQYNSGACQIESNFRWTINNYFFTTYGASFILNGAADQFVFPDNDVNNSSPVDVEIANAGNFIIIAHDGLGPIGLTYTDTDFSDNHVGSPNPSFHLYKV